MGLARGKSAEHRLGGGTFDFASGSAHGGGRGGGGGGGGGVDPLFSPAETVSVAYCLASALAHLHAHGALHYDVKPANTLFIDGNHVPPRARSARLADFGEARITRGGTTTGGKRGTIRIHGARGNEQHAGAACAVQGGRGHLVAGRHLVCAAHRARAGEKRVLAGRAGGRLWSVVARACTQVLQRPDSVCALAVLDGGRLASGCFDNRIHIWSLAGGVEEAVLEGHTI